MMTRSEFLKKIGGIGAFFFIPLHSLKPETKNTLLEFDVRGFRYYKGPTLLAGMQKGEALKLVREPYNKYDEFAIAIHYRDEKIGFVPAEKNEVLSRILDSGSQRLYAEITTVRNDASSWPGIDAVIYSKPSDGLHKMD